MSTRVHNYVKWHRRRCSLTQDELGALLGMGRRTSISRIESGERFPAPRELLALEVIFGEPPSRLFPAFYETVEEKVMARAALFFEKLEHRTSAAAAQKRKLLRAMINRADTNDDA